MNPRSEPADSGALDLGELERLEKEATPGPWYAEPDGPGTEPTVFAAAYNDPDCALIAASRNALPALLARLKLLEDVAGAARDDHVRHWGKRGVLTHDSECPLCTALARLDAEGPREEDA